MELDDALRNGSLCVERHNICHKWARDGGYIRCGNWMKFKFRAEHFINKETWNLVLFLILERVRFRFCGYSFRGLGSRSNECLWEFFIRLDVDSDYEYTVAVQRLSYFDYTVKYGNMDDTFVKTVGKKTAGAVKSLSINFVNCLENLVEVVRPNSWERDLLKSFGHREMLEAVASECDKHTRYGKE